MKKDTTTVSRSDTINGENPKAYQYTNICFVRCQLPSLQYNFLSMKHCSPILSLTFSPLLGTGYWGCRQQTIYGSLLFIFKFYFCFNLNPFYVYLCMQCFIYIFCAVNSVPSAVLAIWIRFWAAQNKFELFFSHSITVYSSSKLPSRVYLDPPSGSIYMKMEAGSSLMFGFHFVSFTAIWNKR